jgi:hypothetical protein
VRSARQGCAFEPHGVGNTTGRSAGPCRSARPHRYPGAGRCKPSALQTAVELRLGEKRAGRLEDVIGPAQFLDLALQCLELLAFAARQAFALAVVNLIAFDPFIEGLLNAADLGCD